MKNLTIYGAIFALLISTGIYAAKNSFSGVPPAPAAAGTHGNTTGNTSTPATYSGNPATGAPTNPIGTSTSNPAAGTPATTITTSTGTPATRTPGATGTTMTPGSSPTTLLNSAATNPAIHPRAAPAGAAASGSFNDVDQDGDGQVSLAESGLTEQQFNARDTNHDGVLSALEFGNPIPR